MTTTTTAVVPFDPAFADPRRLALGGFLAGYSGLTRDAYELDLRQFLVWCDNHQLDVLLVRRADIEAFSRDLEDRGRARATPADKPSGVRSPLYRRVATPDPSMCTASRLRPPVSGAARMVVLRHRLGVGYVLTIAWAMRAAPPGTMSSDRYGSMSSTSKTLGVPDGPAMRSTRP